MINVSIVMTSYNYASYISEAIESVISQTYKDWELIIVDDGSTDNSLAIIQQYVSKDSRIKLYTHSQHKNLGICESVKLGITKASAEWITFLESDDILLPNALEEKINTLEEHSNIDILFNNLILIGNSKYIEEKILHFENLKEYFYNTEQSGYIDKVYKYITFVNIIPTFSVVTAKKSLLMKCKFNPICPSSLDHYLWAQLSHYNFYYMAQKLTKWRIHDQSYIGRIKVPWIKRYFFDISIYMCTIINKNCFVKILLTINYIRKRMFYIKITRKKIKLNFANHKFIIEKDLPF